MNDIPSAPPRTNLILQAAQNSTTRMFLQQAQVTRVPQDLSSLPQATSLRGTVDGRNNDGSTRILTDHGPVDLLLKNTPPKGQRLDIQLSAGSPPKDAIVQSAPKQSASTAQPPSLSESLKNAPQTTPSTTSEATLPAKPVQPQANTDVQILQNTAQAILQKLTGQTPQPGQPLQIGQNIRLTPLPAAQQNIIAVSQLPQAAPAQNITVQQIYFPVASFIAGGPSLQPSALLNTTSLQPMQAILPTNSTPPVPAQDLSTPYIRPTIAQPSTPYQTIRTEAVQPPLIGSAPTAQTPPESLTITARPIPITGQFPPSPATILDVRIIAIHTPAQINATQTNIALSTPLSQNMTPHPVSGNAQVGQIVARVTGHVTPPGQPILQMVSGTPNAPVAHPTFFSISSAASLPRGAEIVLQPQQSYAPQTAQPVAGAGATATPPTPLTSTGWSAFQNLFQMMGQAGLLPQLLNPTASLLPNASQPSQFSAAALIFLAAAKGGNIGTWFPTPVMDHIMRQAGNADKKDIIDRLLRDIGNTQSRAASPADTTAPPAVQSSPDWRGYMLPLLFGADLSKMNLWVHDYGDQNSEDGHKAEGGVRFILDVELSRMGMVEMEGLIQKYAHKFDLILKTERDLSADMQVRMQKIWQRTVQSLDLRGDLSFQPLS